MYKKKSFARVNMESSRFATQHFAPDFQHNLEGSYCANHGRQDPRASDGFPAKGTVFLEAAFDYCR
jgi:hypothetical protein